MRLVLDKIEEMNPGNLKLKQFAGDLANTLKTSYENKIRPAATGGKPGAGKFGESFLEGMGLSGMAEAYKKKAEAKEQRRQDKETFVQNFQNHSEAGKNLSMDTSRQVGESLFEDIQSRQKELADLQAKEKKISEAGYKVDQENLDRQKAIKEELGKLDPRKKDGESKDMDIQQVQKEEAKVEAAELAKEQMDISKKEEGDLTALYTISDDFFKKQTERTDKMVEALETIAEKSGEGGGGLLSSAAEMAGDLAGGKGKAAGKAASTLSKLGKVAKVGGGLLAVGGAAYEGYNEYQDANDKVARGEISKEEGQVKKGEAVGGAAGGAGGALAGAAAGAALGSVVPVVGTAIGGLIGGAVGYWGGKKAGQAVGGGAVQGYQALSGPAATAAPAPTSTNTNVNNQKTTTNIDSVTQSPVYQQEYMIQKDAGADDATAHKAAVAKASKAPSAIAQKVSQAATVATVAPPSTGQVLNQTNTQVTAMKEAAVQPAPSTSTVVNAPVTNVSGGTAPASKPTTKDPVNRETTLDKYLDRRFYPAR